jgi:hypothetical protein
MANNQYNREVAVAGFHQYALGVSLLCNPERYPDLLREVGVIDPVTVVQTGLKLVKLGLNNTAHNLSDNTGRAAKQDIVERSVGVVDEYFDTRASNQGIAGIVAVVRPNPLSVPPVVDAFLTSRSYRSNIFTLLQGVEPAQSLIDELQNVEQARFNHVQAGRAGCSVLRLAS